MLSKNDNNKKSAPKFIFFNKKNQKDLDDFLPTQKIDFDNQILALFEVYFWPFNKSHEKINTFFFDQCNHSFNLKCFYQIPLT